MILNRRTFLAAGLVQGVVRRSAAQTRPAERGPRVLLASEARSPDISAIFTELGLSAEVVPLTGLPAAVTAHYELLWIAAPEYPQPAQLLPATLAKIDEFLKSGRGVFCEYFTNFPRVPASGRMQKTGIARLFVASPLGVPNALPAGTILDEHDSWSLPLTGQPQGTREVLSFGRVRGVGKLVSPSPDQESWAGLVAGESGSGRFAFSTTNLSEFRLRKYAPVAHWTHLLRDIVLALLPQTSQQKVLASYIPLKAWSEPRKWVLPGTQVRLTVETIPNLKVSAGAPMRAEEGGRYRRELKAAQPGLVRIPIAVSGTVGARTGRIVLRVEDRKPAYLRALRRNIQWFERSGVLLRPDGSLGVAEWISGPDTDGNRIPFGAEQMFSPERADCVFESALAFWMHGRLAGSPRHQSTGEKMLMRIMDFQRLERGDKGYGLWNTRGRGGPAFQDDVSWATILSLAGHRYTKRRIFLDRGLISARAQLDAFGTDDTKRAPQYSRSSRRPSLTTKVDEHPHSGGCVLAAWLYTYGVTGERIYLDTALPILDEMILRFPHIRRYIISRTCEASRFLLPLALAAHYTGAARYRDALREQADYLRERMDQCGAIREDGSNTGDSVEGGDLALTYDADETISDQLYTTSFASMNFWIAYKATGDEAYLRDFLNITDYLVRIQIEDSDPIVDGGWMRGFDYSLWEYYGSNADQAWSAYSMETGWQNAIIDIALGLYLMNDPFFEARKPT